MLYNVKFRLTSQFLGSKNTNQGIRRFRRTRGAASDQQDDLLLIEEDVWRWAMLDAVESLEMNVDTHRVHFPPGIKMPSIVLYERNYTTRPKTPHQKPRQRSAKHEAIRGNTILGFRINISQPRPGEKETAPAPTVGELEKIFNHIGEYIGLSPFGNHFGYGRFYVHSITRESSHDKPDIRRTPADSNGSA